MIGLGIEYSKPDNPAIQQKKEERIDRLVEQLTILLPLIITKLQPREPWYKRWFSVKG